MTDTTQQITLLLPKSDSYLLYFLLEANEGISFYSTIPTPNNQNGLVTIECNFHRSTSANVYHLLDQVKKLNLINMTISEEITIGAN